MAVGDSMAPTIAPGDKILIDTAQVTLSPPGIFMLWDGMGMVLKRVEFLQGSYPPIVRVFFDAAVYSGIEIPAVQADIRGRVVAKWSRL
jgi:phage repressor protein C with HTH and peptisase S24 domain